MLAGHEEFSPLEAALYRQAALKFLFTTDAFRLRLYADQLLIVSGGIADISLIAAHT